VTKAMVLRDNSDLEKRELGERKRQLQKQFPKMGSINLRNGRKKQFQKQPSEMRPITSNLEKRELGKRKRQFQKQLPEMGSINLQSNFRSSLQK
jgi:hypothetical protein